MSDAVLMPLISTVRTYIKTKFTITIREGIRTHFR